MNAKYALLDTQTNEYLCGDSVWAFASPYTAKCKFNHFISYGMQLPAYSKQDRVKVVEVVLVEPARMAELEEDENTLLRLQDAGVDNWSGYEYAMSEDFD